MPPTQFTIVNTYLWWFLLTYFASTSLNTYLCVLVLINIILPPRGDLPRPVATLWLNRPRQWHDNPDSAGGNTVSALRFSPFLANEASFLGHLGVLLRAGCYSSQSRLLDFIESDMIRATLHYFVSHSTSWYWFLPFGSILLTTHKLYHYVLWSW